MMDRDNYVGRILTGRISSGILQVGDKVHGLQSTDSGTVKIEEGKVCLIRSYASRFLIMLCIWGSVKPSQLCFLFLNVFVNLVTTIFDLT